MNGDPDFIPMSTKALAGMLVPGSHPGIEPSIRAPESSEGRFEREGGHEVYADRRDSVRETSSKRALRVFP
jgi:hypothetical protein